MKIHFKMLINDGEKYYISDNPGIALCDYVYMRGLESIDDNRFWEEQLAHYQAHKAFNFDLDLVASSSIANISNAIAERIGFDKSKFAESYPRIYLLEDGEFVYRRYLNIMTSERICISFSCYPTKLVISGLRTGCVIICNQKRPVATIFPIFTWIIDMNLLPQSHFMTEK